MLITEARMLKSHDVNLLVGNTSTLKNSSAKYSTMSMTAVAQPKVLAVVSCKDGEIQVWQAA